MAGRVGLLARRLLLALACLTLSVPMTGAVAPALAAPAQAPAVPVQGQVTLVDLGAKTCIPCKMMAPILDELEKEYRGRAAVVFIDVREHNDQVERFKLRAIPTQVFFDRKGREVARHEGFMDKKSIADQLNKLLAK